MSLTAAGAGVLGAGIAATASLGNSLMQFAQNKQNYKFNKRLSQQAFRQNVKMWNMENAYNSPSAQMARFKAAGLNPNLIYGDGTAAAGLASGHPELSYPEYRGKAPFFDVESPIQAAIAPYQMANLESATVKNYSDAGLSDEKAISEAQSRPYVIAKYQKEINRIEWQTQLDIQNVETAKLNNYVKDKVKDLLVRGAELDNLTAEAEIRHKDAMTASEKKSLEVSDSIIDLNRGQLAKLAQDIAESRGRVRLMSSQENLNNATSSKIAKECQILDKEFENYDRKLDSILAKNEAYVNLTEEQKKQVKYNILSTINSMYLPSFPGDPRTPFGGIKAQKVQGRAWSDFGEDYGE